MTVREALADGRRMLAGGKIEDAAFEAEVLLRDTVQMSRAELYLALEDGLSPQKYDAFRSRLGRRLGGEPTAYILGYREFYGRHFFVSDAVLVPRPETELLLEKALEVMRAQCLSVVADVGTGCGAVAVSLALEQPEARVLATDISPAALEIARANCRLHGVGDQVSLLEGDLLCPLPDPVEVIAANLPYVRQSDLAARGALSFEPRIALDGGPDGLTTIRRLCLQAKRVLTSGTHLLLEVGDGQAREVASFLEELFRPAVAEVATDLGGIDRVVALRIP